MNELHSKLEYPLPDYLITQYEEIYVETITTMYELEEQFRQLHTWNDAWLPAY